MERVQNSLRGSGIYKIESVINGKVYVGSAICLKQRWYHHLRLLRKNTHHNKHLQNHYNKYGEEDLLFTVIERCIKSIIIEREQYYINNLVPKFNIAKDAKSPMLGRKQTEAAKNKLRSIKFSEERKQRCTKELKKRWANPEFKEKMSGKNSYFYGKHLTEETKQKIRLNNANRITTEETKQKISKAKKGNTYRRCCVLSEETKQKIGRAKKGSITSEETKKKQSVAHKGKIRTEEHKRNISKGKKGKPNNRKGATQTESAKQKISIAKKGHLTTQETRDKISKTKTGVKLTEEQKAKRNLTIKLNKEKKK